MDYLGSDFNSTGSVIPKSELTAARLKRGECVTCGRRCYKKKLFKMIPIDDEEGKILNGRCLNCNPLHNKTKNSNKINITGHSSRSPIRSSSIRGVGASSKAHRPVATVECGLATSRETEAFRGTQKQKRRGSLSRAMSTPTKRSQTPHNKPSTKTNNDGLGTRSDRSTGNASAPILRSKSMHHVSSHGGNGNEYGHGLCQDSFHSVASSSGGASIGSSSSNTLHTRNSSHHRRRPAPSRQNSVGGNSIGSASSQSLEATPSREELEKAAQTLLAAAQEHGLAEPGGALASSLQDIINIGGAHSNTDEKIVPRQERGILNRGGAFPMKYGRHVYTGSTRTVSSMSSIDEGEQLQQHNPPIQMQQSSSQPLQLHHPSRTIGKSSRTLGSLSTIYGTNEEDFNSLGGDSRGANGSTSEASIGHDGGSSGSELVSVSSSSNQPKTKEGIESVSSVLASKETRAATEGHINNREEETKEIDENEIENHLHQLKNSSSPENTVKAVSSLLEFLSSLSEHSPTSQLEDLLVERGLVGAVVAAMGNHSGSPVIQAKACEILAFFAVCDTSPNHRGSSSIRRRRLRRIVGEERAGEAILFSSMILHEDDPSVQEAALTAIQYLCEDCEENQTGFWKLDAIEPVLRAMEHHRNEPIVQESGALVVSMLAGNPNNEDAKSAIGLNGGISVVLQAISAHLENVRVVTSCIRALYTLTLEDHRNVVVVLETPEAATAILNAMRSHTQNLAVQEMGCATIINLTRESECVDLMIERMGAGSASQSSTPRPPNLHDDDCKEEGTSNDVLGCLIETILESIQAHPGSPAIQDLGCTALANVTDSDETKMFIVDMGALDAIVLAMVLHKDDARVQEQICGLLLLLAVRENHRHILAANPIELVKTAAHKFPEECLEPANRLIRQLGLE